MADYSPLLEAELGNSSSAVTPTTNNDGIPDPPESGLSDAEAQRLLEIYGKSSFLSICAFEQPPTKTITPAPPRPTVPVPTVGPPRPRTFPTPQF